jgi:hypothetical protein
MPVQHSPRPSSMLASVQAAAGVTLAVAGCSCITPLGPDTPPRPTRAAGSPVTVVGPVQLLWASPFFLEAVSFTSPLQVALPSRNQTLQLHNLLVPSS